MKHRIRSAVIITNDDKILLVKHVHPDTGFEWWVPPGGGVDDKDESIFACAARETFEETGLKVELSDIHYVREFYDKAYETLNIEFFIVADKYEGSVSMENIKGSGPDEDFIKEIRWLSKKDLEDKVVFPEILKDDFWKDREEGFPKMRYLGRQA